MKFNHNISIYKFLMQNCKLYIIALFFITISSKAQDLHNSDFSYSQLLINPALTGNFFGNLRLNSTFRNQGEYMLTEGYKTSQIAIDVPFTFSILTGKKNWMGVGIMVFHDNSGSVSQVTNGINTGLSYHFTMDKKQKNIISAGIHFGTQQRKIDDKKVILGSDFSDQSSGLTDRNNLANYRVQFNDLHLGMMYKRKFKDDDYFLIGFSLYHILRSNSQTSFNPDNFLNKRYSFNLDFYHKMNKNFDFQTGLISSFSSVSYNILGNFKLFMKLGKKKSKDTDMLYLGLGYRYSDAIIFMTGIKLKNWNIGISYDITVSEASIYNNGRGALELGVSKIFAIPKKPKIIPVLVCPTL